MGAVALKYVLLGENHFMFLLLICDHVQQSYIVLTGLITMLAITPRIAVGQQKRNNLIIEEKERLE